MSDPKHFKWGPSSSSRWLQCPGSVALSHGAESDDTEYSIDGTKAHDVAATALENGTDAAADDEEIRSAVQVYLDEIREVTASREVIVSHTEMKIKHNSIINFGGTPDHFIIYWEGDKIVLHTFDYKHGVGVTVNVFGNTQLLSYFSIINTRYPNSIDIFRGTIIQPRTFAGDEIQNWECGIEEVESHEAAVRLAQTQTHLKSGTHCQFCPAVLRCPVLNANVEEVAAIDWDEADKTKLARLYELAPGVKNLLKRVDAAMLKVFRKGDEIPGFKVVEKRLSNRKWVSGAEVFDTVKEYGVTREQAFEPPKLKSPSKIEGLLPGKPKDRSAIINQFTTRHKTGYEVVRVTDKGESINLSEVSDFEQVIQDDNSNEG
jgi:hypothetical protein